MEARRAKQRLVRTVRLQIIAIQTSEIMFFVMFFRNINLANCKPFKLSFESFRISIAVYL